MKKKVLLLATIAMIFTVFDSVPVYAQETGEKAQEKSAEQMAIAALEQELGALSGGAVAMGYEGNKTGNSSDDKQQSGENKESEEQETSKSEPSKSEASSDVKNDTAGSEEKETEEKKENSEKEESAEKKESSEKKENSEKETKEEKNSSEKEETKKKETEKEEKKKETKKEKSYTNADVKLLACLIYAEAGNQSYKGKLAVGNVVMNRVKSSLFPNSMEKVIYQSSYSRSYGRTIYQFSVASPSVGTLKKALSVYGKRKNAWEIEAEAECIKAAKAALEGKSAFDGKNYLFFCRYSSSLAARKSGVKIGAHYFYK